MNRASIDGIELEFEVRGSGDPVVLMHNGAGVDWFRPLMEEPALAGRCRVLRYHRAGYADSGPLPGPLSFTEEGARCVALMRYVGIAQAHVVGHSSSGCIALQLALDHPGAVRSLALLEPALMTVPSAAKVPQAVERYRTGDVTGAVDTFLQGTCGTTYRPALETAIPTAFDQATASAATFFEKELPALRQWQFGADDARRVTQPVLAVCGERSDAIHRQRWEMLCGWLPNVEPFVLPGAGHLLHLENLSGMAEGLARFFACHPIAAEGRTEPTSTPHDADGATD